MLNSAQMRRNMLRVCIYCAKAFIGTLRMLPSCCLLPHSVSGHTCVVRRMRSPHVAQSQPSAAAS
jgi:hypothetical protein